MLLDKLQSKVIDFMRFPLIVGVICIHNYSSQETIQGIEYGVAPSPRSLDIALNEGIRDFFSHVLGDISVPLFFLISGFLFFYQTDWGKTVYRRKLISRWHTLFVPYMFWNALALLFSFVVTLPFCRTLYPGAVAQGFQLSFWECLQGFWVDPRITVDGFPGPFAYQFWFIRDLMVMVVLSPVIHWILKRTSWVGVLILGVLWYGVKDSTYIPGLSTVSAFFFVLGAYFSIYRRNLIEESGRLFWFTLTSYPFVACADLLTMPYSWYLFLHRLDIIWGILFVFNLSVWLIRDKGIRVSNFLAGASFFVFAVHVPILLPNMKKVLYILIRPENGWSLLLVYFLVAFLVIGIALLLYNFLKRYASHFTNIITGGR